MKTNKFRVWDIQDKSFYSLEYLRKFKVSISFDGQTINQDFWGGTKTIGEDVIVQQYIGVDDKNKNPIYEGDIVNFQYRDEGLYHGVVDFDDMYAGYSVQKSLAFFGNMQITFHNSAELTVVGNIFENPELLK